MAAVRGGSVCIHEKARAAAWLRAVSPRQPHEHSARYATTLSRSQRNAGSCSFTRTGTIRRVCAIGNRGRAS